MNETLLLVLAWLPVVAESGLFVFAVKFAAKQLKDHFSMPEKLSKDLKDLKSDLGRLNKANSELAAQNAKLHEDLEALQLKLKGIKDYEKESLKKN